MQNQCNYLPLMVCMFVLVAVVSAVPQNRRVIWKCKNGLGCVARDWVCDRANDCGDNSDEKNCQTCGVHQRNCGVCIHYTKLCNGVYDCLDKSDEQNCWNATTTTEVITGVNDAKSKLQKWLLSSRKNGTTTNKWGHQLARTAITLYLSDRSIFLPGNTTSEEMSYELSIQLLSRLSGNKKLNNNELAMYIHAFLVTCIDPRKFYGHDLLSQLRAHVEHSSYTVSPFDFLVLCNAGDTMTSKDVEKISYAFDSQHRPFWTDNQAMATLALACVSARSKVLVDERSLIDMAQELKKRQFRNGTVENLKTTGLVTQALIATKSYNRDFDFEAAIKMIMKSQNPDGSIGSFLDSYYILPVLSNTSLLNITTEHCKPPTSSEEEALNEFQQINGERMSTEYSVWIGNDFELRRTWNLKVPVNSTLYEIIEFAFKLDHRQRVVYNVIDGKPYVSSLNGLDDDVEMSLYWFTYIKTSGSEPELVEESPVDVKIRPNQELILWYKNGKWISSSNRVHPTTETGTFPGS